MGTFPIELTERQRAVLRRVVEDYVATGQPVGSKHLVESASLKVSASTVRAELAELEAFGLLTHPHTSAGRVPTERGYRLYVDDLLVRLGRPAGFPLDLTDARGEVETTLQATTEALSELTRLLALVSAPPLDAATVRHVEVLLLQPHVPMVVVITSTGGVSKRVWTVEDVVDTGLAKWAAEYLNEQVAGVKLGTHALRQRFEDPTLSPRERTFLQLLWPAFTDLADDERRLYVGGTATLLDELRLEDLAGYRDLVDVLEKRAALLEILAGVLDRERPIVRVGDELAHPGLRDVALVGAGYGVLNQTLGAVSLLGPLRMDYEKAIQSVRAAATELSRFAEAYYN
ncbi:MAG: heat-inducible transcription repressor HrcA [Thermoleophilia bacterium]|nr:heat-inducible transcription repressor HrcA [Thermoleophilia bacterium]